MSLRLTSLLLALLLSSSATLAHAQGITLSPAVVTLAGKPGQSVTHQLTLKNTSNQTLAFELEASDVVVRDGARVFVTAGETRDGVAASAVFDPPRVDVAPGASASTQVTLTLPHAVPTRAVTVVFRGGTPTAMGSQRALLSLGTLFTFTLSDHLSAIAEPLALEPPTLTSDLRVHARLLNDGSEPLMAEGMAVVLDAAGRMLGRIPFTSRRLLPGERTQLSADYVGELAPGSYRVVATLDLGGEVVTLTAPLDIG